jgi:hypothetical protein
MTGPKPAAAGPSATKSNPRSLPGISSGNSNPSHATETVFERLSAVSLSVSAVPSAPVGEMPLQTASQCIG